jgi:hypothetical protein
MMNASLAPLTQTASTVVPLETPELSPSLGDIVLGPQPDGACLLARHPGGWQLWFGSHAEAVRLAVRFAAAHRSRVWVRRADQYEPMGAGVMPAAEIG